MITSSQAWLLSNSVCPTCEQTYVLQLIACPGCGSVALSCEDCFAYCPDPRDPPAYSEPCVCRSCGEFPLSEFKAATVAQIRSAGFRPDEYERSAA